MLQPSKEATDEEYNKCAAMLLEALEEGSVAMVTILSSTTPVLILPFIWAQTKRAPAPGAWIGAMLVVLCTWLLVF